MKKLLIISLAVITVSLSSCLKDKPNVDFTHVGTYVELLGSGLSNFSSDAITDPSDTVTLTFQANIDSDYPPSTATTVTIGVDTTLIAAYEATNSTVAYVAIPAADYKINNPTVSIPGGSRLGTFTVTVYKSLLDPSKSYMLPIKIVSTSLGASQISGNLGAHYYHIIGNPFAGSYTWSFYRYNTQDGSGSLSGASFYGSSAKQITIFPVSPTQFEVVEGYYLANVRYEVTFTQVDPTHYKNFQISFNSADVAANFTANGISVTQPPVFGYGTAYDPTQTYTYAQALSFFTFQYVVFNGSAYRYNIDNYVHN